MRSGVIAAALMTTNGPFARPDWPMQRAGGELLARAGRTDDQNAAVGRRHAFDRLAQLRRPMAERPTMLDGSGASCLSCLDLALEPRIFQRAVGDQDQPVRLERLFDEIVCALLDRGDRGFDVAVARNHHDWKVGMLLLDAVKQLQPVELAALQPDVEKDEVRPARCDRVQRVIAVARSARGVALVLQDARNQIADVGLVVDDQNFRRHASAHSLTNHWLFGWSAVVLGLAGGGESACRTQAPCWPGIFSAASRSSIAAAVLLENSADDG